MWSEFNRSAFLDADLEMAPAGADDYLRHLNNSFFYTEDIA